jgi:hypothetical protein
MDLKVDLSFKYTEKDTRTVDINDIIIHFVSSQDQQQNKQKRVQSSSKKYTQTNQQRQNPFAQHEQRMQQMIDEIFGREPQTYQNPQQRVQNNQIAQDSSALKQQMQKQLEVQEKMKKTFQKEVAKNPDFQKEHQQLVKKGYNITDASFNPISNNTGSFEINYKNEKGEQATLKGEMQNGKINKIKKQTPEQRQKLLDNLKKNKDFQKFNQQLNKEGYIRQNAEFNYNENKTIVKVNYLNPRNQTAIIKAEFFNSTIKKIELEKEKQKKLFWWLLLILLAVLLGYFIYKKYTKKSVEEEIKPKIKEKPFDYISEAHKMLAESKKLFEQQKYKDAYGKVGQSLRLFLSYKYGLRKELTNSEVIKILKSKKEKYIDIKRCFDLCSLVEFAKYKPNKKDFNNIISLADKIIIK